VQTTQFDLYDRVVGGDLAEKLASWQSEGLSLQDIAFQLREEHRLIVSPSTVRRWMLAAGLDTSRRTS